MSNLVFEFFFPSIGVPDFSVIAHPYPYRHEFAQVDKRELFMGRFILTTICLYVQVCDNRDMNELQQ